MASVARALRSTFRNFPDSESGMCETSTFKSAQSRPVDVKTCINSGAEKQAIEAAKGIKTSWSLTFHTTAKPQEHSVTRNILSGCKVTVTDYIWLCWLSVPA